MKTLPTRKLTNKVRYLILLIFVMVYRITNAQSGLPFAPTNSYWYQTASFSIQPIHHTPIYYYDNQQTEIKGDTIINNKFLQILNAVSNDYSDCPDFWMYLYNDSNKVYIGINPDSLNLIYNFNLAIGDTFVFKTPSLPIMCGCSAQMSYTSSVTSCDSIYLGGVFRKRITFSSILGKTPIQWVEGIGDYTYGWVLDYSFIMASGNNNTRGPCALVCFNDNGSTHFGTCFQYNCILGNAEYSKQNNYLVYPNPSNDKLNIFLNNYGQTEFMLYDISSRSILKKSFSNHITLDIEQLTRGIYLYEIKNINSNITMGRFIKY